ncbi:MAG: hypothetical protein LBH43_01450 [Treponema sp.]|nr:hypothetical protein [Treponema sp.]
MSRVLDSHQCLSMPDSFKILLSVTQNKWVIAKQDGYAVETVVWKIKYCPFCGEKLEEKQN